MMVLILLQVKSFLKVNIDKFKKNMWLEKTSQVFKTCEVSNLTFLAKTIFEVESALVIVAASF